jgi:hypothetical protein
VPGRGAAFFMPLRRAGAVTDTELRNGPGLAAHHAARAACSAASGHKTPRQNVGNDFTHLLRLKAIRATLGTPVGLVKIQL